MKQSTLPLVILVLAAVGSGQPSHPRSASHVALAIPQTVLLTSREDQSSPSEPPPLVPSYPNSAEGLERMMGDMLLLQRGGRSTSLAPYLASLVLPNPDSWFASQFGTVRCAEAQLGYADCMGPRLAFNYVTTAKSIPASFSLTLNDLIVEGLTNFEAVNYAERCAGPLRIVPAQALIGDLSTTPVFSALVSHHQPIYVLWSYSDVKETIVAFFVYSEGAFRYIGMPHEVSTGDYAQKSKSGDGRSEPVPSAGILTEDQLTMKHLVIDPAAVQRTVVLEVTIGKDGRVSDVSYVRGPEAFKDVTIQSARKMKFEPPGFGPHGFHGNRSCVNLAPSH